jgi:hypothetical protein
MFGELAAQSRTNPQLIYGFGNLQSTFNFDTGSLGTPQNTGLSLSVPSAGTYLVWTQQRCVLNVTFNTATVAYVTMFVYQTDLKSVVTPSSSLAMLITDSALLVENSSSGVHVVTATAACNFQLWAQLNTNGSITAWTLAQIVSDLGGALGGTSMAYLKVK